jgi:hypothetical protein
MAWNSKKLAEIIRAKIIENTLAGKDKYGKDFKPYSTRPFAMPSGAVANKKKLEKSADTKKQKKGVVSFHTTKKGALWVTWLGGYKQYKKIMYEGKPRLFNKSFSAEKPNLWATGGMLKSFAVLSVTNKGAGGATYKLKTNFGEFNIPIPEVVDITLGWTDKKKADIARYNKERGRDMFGLPPKELDEIVKKMVEGVE